MLGIVHEAAAKMIDAAERIVAEQGMAALTVQAVQQAAGQRNKSAVQYHFGGRDGLIEALLATRLSDANERRTEMLLELDGTASIRELVEVLVVPLVEAVQRRTPSHWARFLVQAMNDPATGLATLAAIDDKAFTVAQNRLAAILDHLPEPLRLLRIQGAVGYACIVLAAAEVGLLPAPFGTDPASGDLATELVDACCGIVLAPSTTPAPSRA